MLAPEIKKKVINLYKLIRLTKNRKEGLGVSSPPKNIFLTQSLVKG